MVVTYYVIRATLTERQNEDLLSIAIDTTWLKHVSYLFATFLNT